MTFAMLQNFSEESRNFSVLICFPWFCGQNYIKINFNTAIAIIQKYKLCQRTQKVGFRNQKTVW